MDDKNLKILLENGFMPWRWGNEKKLEGYLNKGVCENLIGIKEKCYVTVLLDENEARFITNNKFEQKVSGHENQIQIERILFGKDKSKLYTDGRLVLIEEIISLNRLINYLINNKTSPV